MDTWKVNIRTISTSFTHLFKGVFSIDFLYLPTLQEIAAKFNKLIKTIGHRARFFENWLITTTFAKNFDSIRAFSYCYLSSL